MNVKMKALIAAAVAAMSVSGAANAFDKGGDSSVFLTLLDSTNNISAVFDLGFHYQTFAVGGAESSVSFNWDLSTGAYADTWNTFFATADVASTKWGVAAFDHVGSNRVAGEFGFITTLNEGASVPDKLYTTLLTTITGKLDLYLEANEKNGNVSTSGTGYASPLYAGVNGSLNGRGPNSLAYLGVEQGVVQYLSGAGVGVAQAPVIYDSASFQLDANGALRYTVAAAVPEPETYALLLAGLGLVGFAARRRKSA